MTGLTPIFAALLGAIAAGLFQTIMAVRNRAREKESTLVALASEVDALCSIIRDQHYLEDVEALLTAALGGGIWNEESLIVDVRANYFEVFSANASKLGTLDPAHVRDIVRFYSLCKTAVDSMRPDGPVATRGSRDERVSALRDQVAVFQSILALGDRIVTYPRLKLEPQSLRPEALKGS